MKRNDLYILKQIENDYFLVPTGQAVATSSSIERINETGAFLWNALNEDLSLLELQKKVLNEYAIANEEQQKQITSDVADFVFLLKNKGLIFDAPALDTSNQPSTILNIAGISISLYIPTKYIGNSLMAFKSEVVSSDQIFVYGIADLPKAALGGQIIIKNSEVLLTEATDYYTLTYANLKYIKEIHISKDFETVQIYYIPEDHMADQNEAIDELCREFTLALRTPFLLKALSLNKVMLHSASIVYQDKVYCFSAPSGVGKSTHVSLWEKLFNTPIFNGDLNLIEKSNEKLIVWGTPWCGTSGIYSNATLELGGVIFLRQGDHNKMARLDKADAFEKFMARVISPTANKEMAQNLINLCSDFSGLVPMYFLVCTADDEAALVAKAGLDQ